MKLSDSMRVHIRFFSVMLSLIAALLSNLLFVNVARAENTIVAKKILVVYFSHSGNTEALAKKIHSVVGGDIVQITTAVNYSDDYDTTLDQAKKEQNSNALPAVTTKINNIEQYDALFIGYPIWWGALPRPVVSFIRTNTIKAKFIAPFATHEGSRMGKTESELKSLLPDATILRGFPVRGRSAASIDDSEIERWLKDIEMTVTK